MIPGVKIQMGGQDWIIPPLTLGQLRRLVPKVRQLITIGAEMNEEQIGILVELVATAMQRNYSEATIEMVENILDLGNASAVMSAILTGSGLKLGETQAVAIANLNGVISTDSSPPPAGTLTQ